MIYVKAGIISKKKHRYFFIHEDKILATVNRFLENWQNPPLLFSNLLGVIFIRI